MRFKHGVHTIYLFVDSLAPFSETTKELLELLRERYEGGLTTSISPAKVTPIPSEAKLVYGVLNVATDPSRGWKKLKTGENDVNTPTKCGLKNNSILAFAILDEDSSEDDILFEVEWPLEDDELYEQTA